MRLITYRTERWTEAYHARPEDHGLQLSCTASVPGLPPYVEFSQLDIDCESNLQRWFGSFMVRVVVVICSCNQYTIQEAFKLNYAKVSRTGLNPI